jgi:hypothetical protein
MHIPSLPRFRAPLRSIALITIVGVGTVAGAAFAGAASSGTRPAGPQAGTTRGQLQLTDYSSNDGSRSTVVLTGVIGDYGEGLREVSKGGAARQYDQMVVDLTHGSFTLDIAGLEDDLVREFRYFPSNTGTCSGVVTASGLSPIVTGSGTGAYKGISGDMHLTTTVHEVDSWPKCVALLSEVIVVSGIGTVTLH